jgi:hypothetical protein
MILFGKKHLHVSESDQIVDDLFKILNSASGSLNLEVAGQPALKIEINRNDNDQVKELTMTEQ